MKNKTDKLAQVFQKSRMPIHTYRTQNKKLQTTTRCIKNFVQEVQAARQSPKTAKIHFIIKEKVHTR